MGDEVGVIEVSNGGANVVESNEKFGNMENCEIVDEVVKMVYIEKDEGEFEREAMDEDDVTTIEKAELEDEKVEENNEESEYDDEEDIEEDKEESDEESLKKRVLKNISRSAKKYTNKRPVAPVTPAIERPQRERKSVDRLVSTFKKAKKFEVVQGHGTALKDIPNVQYNLSQKKWEESIKLLHSVLFARRGQASKYKANIARFSGVASNDNEEKEKVKLKERFDKCVRGKLLEFCNILDIQGVKSASKKEDIVTKLTEFLEAPHATRDKLIAEKGKKRKRVVKKGSSASKSSSSKKSAKIQKGTEKAFKNGKVKKSISSEDESSAEEEKEEGEEEEEEEEEEQTHEESDNGIPEISDDEMSNQIESETETKVDESEEEKVKNKKDAKKSSTKKVFVGKAAKKVVSPKSSQAESEKGVESEEEEEKSLAKKEFAGSSPNKEVLQESGLAESENEGGSEDESENTVKKKEVKRSGRKYSAGKAAEKVVSQKYDEVEREDSGDEFEEENKEKVAKKLSPKKESTDKTAKKVVPRKSLQAGKTAKKESTMRKSNAKETSGKKLTKGKEKQEEDTLVPDDDKLRAAISNILKEVDLHSASFIDILKHLVNRFETDLISRKGTIKRMIQDELTNQIDESEDEDEVQDIQEELSSEIV